MPKVDMNTSLRYIAKNINRVLNTLFLFCLKTNSIEFFRTCLYHYCRYVCTYVWAHVYTKFENFTRHKCIILWGIYTIYVKTFLYTFEYISIYLQLHHIFLVCKTFRQKPSKMILKCAWHIILNLHTLTHLRTNFVLVFGGQVLSYEHKLKI